MFSCFFVKTKKYKHSGKVPAGEEEEEAKETSLQSRVALPRVTVPQCCKVCDGALTIGGPIWTAPIHDVDYVKRLIKVVRDSKEVNLGTSKRI